MHMLFSRLVKAIDATFGTCSICMRKSLAASLAASGLYIAAALIWPDRLLQMVLGLLALALFGLWMIHVITYAARAVVIARRKGQQAASGGTYAVAPVRNRLHINRRGALGIFAKAAGVAVFASTAFWPFMASANQHVCGDGSYCEIGNKCCWNSESEAYFCCASSHLCCVDGQSSYCRNPSIGEYC